jgi:hypothetical protein
MLFFAHLLNLINHKKNHQNHQNHQNKYNPEQDNLFEQYIFYVLITGSNALEWLDGDFILLYEQVFNAG